MTLFFLRFYNFCKGTLFFNNNGYILKYCRKKSVSLQKYLAMDKTSIQGIVK